MNLWLIPTSYLCIWFIVNLYPQISLATILFYRKMSKYASYLPKILLAKFRKSGKEFKFLCVFLDFEERLDQREHGERFSIVLLDISGSCSWIKLHKEGNRWCSKCLCPKIGLELIVNNKIKWIWPLMFLISTILFTFFGKKLIGGCNQI